MTGQEQTVAAVLAWQRTIDAAWPTPQAAAGGAQVNIGNLKPDQLANAQTIINVGRQLGLPPRAWVIAVATAMQESKLTNLDGGDRDSIGLFQQRPSQGWGTPAQIRDPQYAATQFYQRLRKVPNYQHLPLTVAAQSVQHSGFPNAYAKWEPLADAVVQKESAGH